MQEIGQIARLAARSLLIKLRRSHQRARIIRNATIELRSEGRIAWVTYFAVAQAPDCGGLEIISAYAASVTRSDGCGSYSVDVKSEHEAPEPRLAPPYILEILSPISSEKSKYWRACCAASQWNYRINVIDTKSGLRRIEVLLSNHVDHVIIETSDPLDRQEFSEYLEAVIRKYAMSNIEPVQP